MIPTFDLLRRTLAATTLVALTSVAAAAAPASNDSASDGHFKQCHGYIRHISDVNIKVHCIDGVPSDQSFIYFPRYAHLRDGKSIEVKELHADTPVHVLYTQTLGVKKAYEIFVTDQNGNGLYDVRT